MSETVYLQHAEIHNLANIEFFETALTAVNIASGANSTGKTSFTRAIMLIFASGNDPRLLQNGKDKGWATVTFTDGYKATKTLFREDDGQIGYTLEVLTPEGGAQKAPVTFLKDRLPQQAFDVDEFLAWPTDKQIEFLLSIMPITFSAEAVNAALDARVERTNVIAITPAARAWLAQKPDAEPRIQHVTGEIDLKKFDELYDLRYSQRKKLNGLKRDVAGALSVLQGSLANDDGKNWTAEREYLELELSKVKTAIGSAQSSIRLESEQMRAAKREEIHNAKTKLQAVISEYLNAVDALGKASKAYANNGLNKEEWVRAHNIIVADSVSFGESVSSIIEANAELLKYLAIVDKTEAESLTEQTAALEADRARLSEELGIARTRAQEQQRGTGVRIAITEHEENIRALAMNEEDLSRSLLALEELRARKLSALPIPGFSIAWVKKNPVMTIDEIEFSRLNSQAKIYAVVRFFRLARPACPLQILESSELDTVHFGNLVAKLTEIGAQVVTARWLPNCEHLEVFHSELEYLKRLNEANLERYEEIRAK